VIANALDDDKPVRGFGTEAMNVVITVHWQTRHCPEPEQVRESPAKPRWIERERQSLTPVADGGVSQVHAVPAGLTYPCEEQVPIRPWPWHDIRIWNLIASRRVAPGS